MAAAARAPTSLAIALFTFAVTAASSVNSPALRFCCSACWDAQPAPSTAASATALAVKRMRKFMATPCLRACRLARGGRRPFASAGARAPRGGAPARGRRAASDRKASAPRFWAPPVSCRSLAGFPFANLFLRVVLHAAVALLDLAHELVAMAGELVELVVRNLAPALLERALHLLPVTRDAIPVHCVSLPCWSERKARCKLHARRLDQTGHGGKKRDRLDRLGELSVVAGGHRRGVGITGERRGAQATAPLGGQRSDRADQNVAVVAANRHVGQHDVGSPILQKAQCLARIFHGARLRSRGP